MTTQIMFKIEEKLKKAAQKRAKKEGITLSDFYQSATKSFVEGRINVGLTMEEESWDNYTKQSKTSFKRGLADFKAGRIRQVR
jgi:antitoxin component of RelBE/YafQ-DinJ toxin-antitoxin module